MNRPKNVLGFGSEERKRLSMEPSQGTAAIYTTPSSKTGTRTDTRKTRGWRGWRGGCPEREREASSEHAH